MPDFIPSNQRYPLTAVQISNRFAEQGTSRQPYRTLFFGPKLASGSAALGVRTQVLFLGDAAKKFGRGSACYEFAKSYFENGATEPLWIVPVDDSGLTARVVTATFTASNLKAGTLALYVAGRRYAVNVTDDQSADDVAANALAAIQSDPDCLFSAASAGGVLTLTSKNRGEFTQEFQVAHSESDGEELPSGLTVAFADPTAGSGVVASLPLDSVQDSEQFVLWSTCFTDDAFLALVTAELDRRDAATVKTSGQCLVGFRGSAAELVTKGNASNSRFLTIFPCVGNGNAVQVAGSLVGAVSSANAGDPGAPMRNRVLRGVLPPKPSDILSTTVLNTLLNNGVSAYSIVNGNVAVASLITTYKTDADGLPDASYLDLAVMLVLSFLRYDLNVLLSRNFAGYKIGERNVRYNTDQKMATTSAIKGTLVSRFRDWQAQGLVEGVDAFKRSLVVERDPQNANQINIYLYPDVINELKILATDIRFLIQGGSQ